MQSSKKNPGKKAADVLDHQLIDSKTSAAKLIELYFKILLFAG